MLAVLFENYFRQSLLCERGSEVMVRSQRAAKATFVTMALKGDRDEAEREITNREKKEE